ncbi:hypothetical protein Tco_1184630 [Tanacetum coccineum]
MLIKNPPLETDRGSKRSKVMEKNPASTSAQENDNSIAGKNTTLEFETGVMMNKLKKRSNMFPDWVSHDYLLLIMHGISLFLPFMNLSKLVKQLWHEEKDPRRSLQSHNQKIGLDQPRRRQYLYDLRQATYHWFQILKVVMRIHLREQRQEEQIDAHWTTTQGSAMVYLDDVRTALNDRLKGIRMEYLPQTFWSQRDKANARAMIQAIDKRLKTRRIMRSLERFVGGRPYGGDLRLLQRTI